MACDCVCVCAIAVGCGSAWGAPARTRDALAFYNADAPTRARVGKRIAAARQVALSRVELHGWGKLVNEPSKRPGRLVELEAAGPVGFSARFARGRFHEGPAPR